MIHALFSCDFYLGRFSIPFKEQEFHKAHHAEFADYEEMERRKAVRLYDKSFCVDYLHHCQRKLKEVIENESLESLM